MFQAHALSYPLLLGFPAEGLTPLDDTANRFEFSFGLPLITFTQSFPKGTVESASSARSSGVPFVLR
jgi:hypothetical protein